MRQMSGLVIGNVQFAPLWTSKLSDKQPRCARMRQSRPKSLRRRDKPYLMPAMPIVEHFDDALISFVLGLYSDRRTPDWVRRSYRAGGARTSAPAALRVGAGC
jgi:hypothetical protein